MNYAVYLIAIGNTALHLLKLAFKTLRESGFRGDVYILSDVNILPFSTDERTFLKKILKTDLNLDSNSNASIATCDVRRLDQKNPRNRRNASKFAICHMKAFVDKYVPIEKYNYLVYLDVDILVSGSIKIFESFLQKHNGSIITSQDKVKILGESYFYLSRLWFKKGTRTANLSKWELFKYWFKTPLCADIICIPINKDGKKFLKLWQEECQKGIDSDQAALQAVLLRHFQKQHVLAPYSIFGYGPVWHEYAREKKLEKVDSMFIHFGGAVRYPNAMEDYYQKYLFNQE